jgi:macrolide export ATP-binding/permease macB
MNHIIELEQVTKYYKSGSTLALNNITLSIPDKSVTAVIGKSGCGKTTLLNMIGGLDTVSSGRVSILGTDITEMPESKLSVFRSENIGFVFQFFHLIPELTAIENILFPTVIRKRVFDQDKLDLLVNLLGIQKNLGQMVSQLSGGEQQRVAIARAVLLSPKLLLMDEPTGNLDAANSEIIRTLIKQLRDEFEISVFYVTHDLEMAQVADSIIRMKDGQIEWNSVNQ